MNKITTLSAIAMFAVIMGMSAFAPAALASPNSDHNDPKTDVCHFDRDTNDDGDTTTDDRAWIEKSLNKHALVAHIGHGDYTITGATNLGNFEVTEADCINQVIADPDL